MRRVGEDFDILLRLLDRYIIRISEVQGVAANSTNRSPAIVSHSLPEYCDHFATFHETG